MEEDLTEFSVTTERRETGIIPKIIAVRHAESVANTQGIYQGRSYDTDLSPLGKKQAQALAKRLKKLGIRKIITSPLRRTYQTAFEVSSLCDCPIEVSELIVETHHGIWEGKNKDWIKKNYPKIYKTWLTKPGSVIFPEGEAFTETLKRVQTFLEKEKLSNDTLVVTHDNIVRIMITLANGWTLDDLWKHHIEPAALNFFEINSINGNPRLNLLKLNDNAHLKGLHADLSKHAL